MSDEHLDVFERALADIMGEPKWKVALIDVCDTAYLCKRWFEARNLPFTAADVIALTKLVIRREERNVDAAERSDHQ